MTGRRSDAENTILFLSRRDVREQRHKVFDDKSHVHGLDKHFFFLFTFETDFALPIFYNSTFRP